MAAGRSQLVGGRGCRPDDGHPGVSACDPVLDCACARGCCSEFSTSSAAGPVADLAYGRRLDCPISSAAVSVADFAYGRRLDCPISSAAVPIPDCAPGYRVWPISSAAGARAEVSLAWPPAPWTTGFGWNCAPCWRRRPRTRGRCLCRSELAPESVRAVMASARATGCQASCYPDDPPRASRVNVELAPELRRRMCWPPSQ